MVEINCTIIAIAFFILIGWLGYCYSRKNKSGTEGAIDENYLDD